MQTLLKIRGCNGVGFCNSTSLISCMSRYAFRFTGHNDSVLWNRLNLLQSLSDRKVKDNVSKLVNKKSTHCLGITVWRGYMGRFNILNVKWYWERQPLSAPQLMCGPVAKVDRRERQGGKPWLCHQRLLSFWDWCKINYDKDAWLHPILQMTAIIIIKYQK